MEPFLFQKEIDCVAELLRHIKFNWFGFKKTTLEKFRTNELSFLSATNDKNLIKSIIYSSIVNKMLEQFSLRAEKSEKKKEFVKSLYELTQRVPSSSFQFQIRRGDGVRTPEPTMTLDNFFGLVDNDFRIKIHTGEEAPPKFDFPATLPPKEIRIVCTALGIDPWRFAWYACPDTKENYKTINQLVMAVFGRDLSTYKVA